MTTLKSLPKTPKTDFLKSMKEVAKDMLRYNEKLEKVYGDTYQIDLAYLQLYVTSNPDLIKQILQTNHKNYVKSLAYDKLKMGLGNGLVTSEGDYWRKQRRLSQPVFYKNNLENLFVDMGRTTTEFLNTMEQLRGSELDISKLMMEITATIVLRSLFNVEESQSLDKIYESVEVMQRYIIKHVQSPIFSPLYYLTSSHQEFKMSMKNMDDLVYGMMHERRESGEKKADLLQMLMDVEDADTGEKMTDLQLRDELITLFSAGHETSANTLGWTFYMLAQHPEIVEKIRAEVNRILPNKEMPTFEQLREMTYTEQVINEGMRLFPPAWVIGRRALEDDEFEGFEIKKDVNILCEIYLMQRSEKLWDKPDEFNPDRFSAEAVKARPRHHFVPFGAGPRMCIGNHFAMMEMQLLMATIVQRFDFSVVESHKVELDALITLRPKYGIKLKIK
jgi:cytochrome P450